MRHPLKGQVGFQRIAKATGYSLAGLRAAYRHESAFRQEVWMCAVLAPACYWLGRNWVEVTLLAGSAAFVLVVELLNSAIESVVDRISHDTHELSKRAKDIASAAVLMSSLLCAGIWLTLLWIRLTA